RKSLQFARGSRLNDEGLSKPYPSSKIRTSWHPDMRTLRTGGDHGVSRPEETADVSREISSAEPYRHGRHGCDLQGSGSAHRPGNGLEGPAHRVGRQTRDHGTLSPRSRPWHPPAP